MENGMVINSTFQREGIFRLISPLLLWVLFAQRNVLQLNPNLKLKF